MVKNLKEQKSPGLDGLTPEFYKACWKDIKMIFKDMLKETFEVGELPDSLKKAVVTLIFKKDDKTKLKNYRPISVTNYDYKILAFTLSNRLQQVIAQIVNEDQSGYIKNRFIGCNIRLAQDIIDFTNIYKKQGILISLDFQKAFDSLEWNFMECTLHKFNFGNNFIKWIKILYNNPV